MTEPEGRDRIPAYDFTRCDDCGGPLEPEARLYGLCAQCEGAVPPSIDDEQDA